MPLKRAAFLYLYSGVHQLTALWVLMDKQLTTLGQLAVRLQSFTEFLFWPCFLLRQQSGLYAIADMQFLQNIGYIMFDGFFGQE